MKKIVNISLLLATVSTYSVAHTEYTIENTTVPTAKKSESSSNKYSKSSASRLKIGNYVWFDYNQNGTQDLGELGLYHVQVNLYPNANCRGSSSLSTFTSDTGYYEFKNLKSSTEYCVGVVYPQNWTNTLVNRGDEKFDSNLQNHTSAMGRIPNIVLSKTDMSLDAGLHHSNPNCQTPVLRDGLIGVYGHENSWARRYNLDVKINDVVAQGFCHEAHDGGPKAGEHYSVHSVDRKGFSAHQLDRLSRIFSYMSDPEILNQIDDFFEEKDREEFFAFASNTLVWYYSDWNENFSKVEDNIYNSWWRRYTSDCEKSFFTDIIQTIIAKVDGREGYAQYPSMKVYYLWNEDSTSHQDIIVPSTLVVPNQTECSVGPYPKATIGDRVWLDSNYNGIQDNNEMGLSSVSVELYNQNNQLVGQRKTNNQGKYLFTNQVPGSYYLKFRVPNGYTLTSKAQGANRCKDSDVGTGGKTQLTQLVAGENDVCWDMGLYVTPQPSIDIEVATNGSDADKGTGPKLNFGESVTWTYVVKNSGNVPLKNVVVTDNRLNEICRVATLAVNESKTCTKTGTAVEGQYSNLGTVNAQTPQNIAVRAEDPSHYLGGEKANPSVDIEVATNGSDADTATGPKIEFDKTVTWTYVVRNSGNVPLKDVVVTDSKLNEICRVATLAVNATKTCTKEGKAVEGQYANVGTVNAKSPQNVAVKDSDPSHYLGGEASNPSVDIEVATNGKDADQVTGPKVKFGESVTWTYVVRNDGNVPLKDVIVTDNKLNEICRVATLAVNATKTCTKTGKAVEGQYANVGTVSAKSPKNIAVKDEDPSHYIGEDVEASISIESSTNGKDADSENQAVALVAGDKITWSYVVKNIGKVDLTNIVVLDNKIQGIVCTVDKLAVGESKTCTKEGVAIEGPYENIGKVTAEYRGKKVEDSDKSHYEGGKIPESLVNIGNFVWWDKNANGIQETNEAGIVGVVVELLAEDGSKVQTTTTDTDGKYLFASVAEGKYKIKFTQPKGYVGTSPKHNGDDTRDSDGSESGLTDLFTVALDDRLDIDMGYTKGRAPQATDDSKHGERCSIVIQDILKNDSDVDKDINSSSVSLVAPDGAEAIDTDSDGDIDKIVVPDEGTWSVDDKGLVTFKPNNECTGTNPTPIEYSVKDGEGNPSNEATISVVYPDLEKAQLGNRVWFDPDKNGKQDKGEAGLEGVTVELYNANGDLNGTTTTDEDGVYGFVNLEAGEYTVKFIPKDGWSITKKSADGVLDSNNSDADTQTGITEAVVLQDGDKNMDIDAGMYRTPKPEVTLVKTTNGGNVGNVLVGDAITWTYTITNSGNTPLRELVITDQPEGSITDCTGDGSLEILYPTKSITCTKVGVAILGAYSNSATVVAKDTEDKNVTATDTSTYVGKSVPVETGTIGDYVWLDLNRNGVQDTDDIAFGGIVVKLFDKSGKKIAETQTDDEGHYVFENIVKGQYHIEFTVPNGYTVTEKGVGADRDRDSDANTQGKTSLFTLAEGVDMTSIDMGLYPTVVKLGNRVWYDENRNGIQDAEEKNKNVANVGVKLYKEDGTLVGETKTNSAGLYEFKDLSAGRYYVIFDIPQTYKVTSKREGSNRSSDSNADTTTGKTDIIVLKAGINDPTIDMGLYHDAAKVGDRVWYDSNKNGIQDNNENDGVGDVVVKLYRVGGDQPVAETKTSATGIYLFDNVTPGEYYLEFVAPAAYTITDKDKGNDDNKDSDVSKDGKTANFTLESGTQNSTVDMGLYQNMVSLGDRVWIDTNSDGLQNIGEKGVKDVNVTIHSENSEFVKSVLTDENGNYLFSHLSAGEYSLEFNHLPKGYLITKKDVSGNDKDANDSDVFLNDDKKLVTEATLLIPGENDLSWDMGIYKTVIIPGKSAIGNLVWEDFNRDGIQDIGERGISGVTVELFNNDTDAKVATTVTNKNGLYEFVDVDPAFNYYVQFKVPAGYHVSPQDQDDDVIDSDTDEHGKTDVITVEANKINSSVDMGIYQEGSTIGDRVWYDEKGGVSNGIQDEGELGVHNIKVTLYDVNGDVVQTTRTNASGEYHFTKVPKGTYSVGFSDLPAGYIFTTSNSGDSEEHDSDAKMNGRTGVIRVDGSKNITNIDAGIRTRLSGNSSSDIKQALSGEDAIVDVLANDSEGSYPLDPKSVKITTVPDGATLSDNGKTLTVPGEGVWSVDPNTGAIKFSPEKGFVGDPTPISYGVSDTQGNETNADVRVNYPPVAQNDHVNGESGKQIVVHVLDNDTNTSSPLDPASVRIIDPKNGDEVEILEVNGEGTWSVNSNGTITFTPEDGLNKNPTPIEYIVKEQEGDVSNRATVTIEYPDAVDDVVTISANHSGVITVNVLENDRKNSNNQSVTLGCKQPGKDEIVVQGEGVWRVGDDGVVTFTPETNFSGEPTDIKYTVELENGKRSNCANIDIRYELRVRDDSATMNVGGETRVNVLGNDLGSIDKDTLRLVIPENAPKGTELSNDGKTLTVPGEGVWSVVTNGVVKFVPEDGFTKVPTPIHYTVENGDGTKSNEGTIKLTQGGVGVTVHNDTVTVNGSGPIVVDVLGNDGGVEAGSTVLLVDKNGTETQEVSILGEGTWSVNANNSIVFTPEAGYVGTPSPINYIVRDTNGNSSEIATITVRGTCSCEDYEESVSAMSNTASLLLMLLTLVIGLTFFREEKIKKIK